MADELASTEEEQAGAIVSVEEEGAEVASPRTTEDFARERGWVPKAEWTGEGEWRDAESFIAFGLDRARDLNRDVKQLREATEELRRTQREEAQKAAERAKADERKRWEQMLSVAVQEGDEGKAFEATQKIAEISVQPVSSPHGDPLVAKFIADNSWFNSDVEATALAAAAAGRIGAIKGPDSVAEQLEEALKAVHKRFPEYAPAQAAPAKVVDVSRPQTRLPSQGSRVKGFADLTADQQLAAKYLVQTGKIKNVEAYVAQAFNAEGTIE